MDKRKSVTRGTGRNPPDRNMLTQQRRDRNEDIIARWASTLPEEADKADRFSMPRHIPGHGSGKMEEPQQQHNMLQPTITKFLTSKPRDHQQPASSRPLLESQEEDDDADTVHDEIVEGLQPQQGHVKQQGGDDPNTGMAFSNRMSDNRGILSEIKKPLEAKKGLISNTNLGESDNVVRYIDDLSRMNKKQLYQQAITTLKFPPTIRKPEDPSNHGILGSKHSDVVAIDVDGDEPEPPKKMTTKRSTDSAHIKEPLAVDENSERTIQPSEQGRPEQQDWFSENIRNECLPHAPLLTTKNDLVGGSDSPLDYLKLHKERLDKGDAVSIVKIDNADKLIETGKNDDGRPTMSSKVHREDKAMQIEHDVAHGGEPSTSVEFAKLHSTIKVAETEDSLSTTDDQMTTEIRTKTMTWEPDTPEKVGSRSNEPCISEMVRKNIPLKDAGSPFRALRPNSVVCSPSTSRVVPIISLDVNEPPSIAGTRKQEARLLITRVETKADVSKPDVNMNKTAENINAESTDSTVNGPRKTKRVRVNSNTLDKSLEAQPLKRLVAKESNSREFQRRDDSGDESSRHHPQQQQQQQQQHQQLGFVPVSPGRASIINVEGADQDKNKEGIGHEGALVQEHETGGEDEREAEEVGDEVGDEAGDDAEKEEEEEEEFIPQNQIAGAVIMSLIQADPIIKAFQGRGLKLCPSSSTLYAAIRQVALRLFGSIGKAKYSDSRLEMLRKLSSIKDCTHEVLRLDPKLELLHSIPLNASLLSSIYQMFHTALTMLTTPERSAAGILNVCSRFLGVYCNTKTCERGHIVMNRPTVSSYFDVDLYSFVMKKLQNLTTTALDTPNDHEHNHDHRSDSRNRHCIRTNQQSIPLMELLRHEMEFMNHGIDGEVQCGRCDRHVQHYNRKYMLLPPVLYICIWRIPKDSNSSNECHEWTDQRIQIPFTLNLDSHISLDPNTFRWYNMPFVDAVRDMHEASPDVSVADCVLSCMHRDTLNCDGGWSGNGSGSKSWKLNHGVYKLTSIAAVSGLEEEQGQKEEKEEKEEKEAEMEEEGGSDMDSLASWLRDDMKDDNTDVVNEDGDDVFGGVYGTRNGSSIRRCSPDVNVMHYHAKLSKWVKYAGDKKHLASMHEMMEMQTTHEMKEEDGKPHGKQHADGSVSWQRGVIWLTYVHYATLGN